VVASLILAGAEPVWLRPRWDAERQIAYPAPVEELNLEQAMSPRDYLRAGLAAGMTLPDAADPELNTFRVVRD
jgi:arginine/lysine/ornithine decarboxylase